ncbi:hypothetical protein EYF80_001563 [Liparis tanakae]|uniref:Uncharacterized protein n=1 Tax=Liparis tanakae TaxID=230148 RepID=A0A4Z2JEE6_9TELE|nr:hypothetical protein EYF80_001563 [Liparis tanakae]
MAQNSTQDMWNGKKRTTAAKDCPAPKENLPPYDGSAKGGCVTGSVLSSIGEEGEALVHPGEERDEPMERSVVSSLGGRPSHFKGSSGALIHDQEYETGRTAKTTTDVITVHYAASPLLPPDTGSERWMRKVAGSIPALPTKLQLQCCVYKMKMALYSEAPPLVITKLSVKADHLITHHTRLCGQIHMSWELPALDFNSVVWVSVNPNIPGADEFHSFVTSRHNRTATQTFSLHPTFTGSRNVRPVRESTSLGKHMVLKGGRATSPETLGAKS